MKSCGFEKSRMSFSNCTLVVLMIISGVKSLIVIRSTTSRGGGDVDRFSNTPTCNWFDCFSARSSSRCSSFHANCCFCECNDNRPNYVISARRCEANNKIAEDCQFDVASNGDDQPLFVKEMTKTGHVDFQTPDVCRTMKVTKWSYRLTGQWWIVGSPNRFKVQSVVGADNRWRLRWDKGLDAEYAGLILKFDFTCQNAHGCLLMKSKGNYTIPTPGSSSPLPPLEPSDVVVDATGGKTGPTLKSGASHETNGKTKNKFKTAAETQREVEAKHSGVVVAGVTLSLAAGIVLVFATLLLMMKKRRGEMQTKGPRQNAPSVSYEEPIQSTARSGTTLDGATFHNAFYSSDCVLSISAQRTATIDNPSKLGPLPPLPTTEEAIYEEPIIKRNVAYQDLDKETKQETGTAGEQQTLPVYNILEPPDTNDGDYDDNIAEYRNSDA